MYDVAVIGGGPAGATAGRLLAEWGHVVVILERPPARQSLAESLPPSTRKILGHVGMLERVERAGFVPATGNTSWWGEPLGRSEGFAAASGYQVLRRDLDRLLLEAARESGAALRRGVSVRRVDVVGAGTAMVEYARRDEPSRLRARFVLDCSGRAGVVARRFRVKDRRLTTVAFSAVWRSRDGFRGVDPGHTLVEAFEDGWAWSVPLARDRRHVAVMVDPLPAGTYRGRSARYHAELAKATQMARVLDGAVITERPWACDASVYSARVFAGERFLLVGDAASFLDPMSSFGVKKALASAWMAAVVANTCLRRPERAAAALALFASREREMAATYEREALRYARDAAARHTGAFWRRRAEIASQHGGEPADLQAQAAFVELKRRRRLRLQAGPGTTRVQAAEIQGREVVLAEALAAPALPEGVRYVRGVLVPALLQVAPARTDVAALHAAYNNVAPPVSLPDFVSALAYLIARGVVTAWPSTP